MRPDASLTLLTKAVVSLASVSYDASKDNGTRSLAEMACADGAFGLTTRYGWQTQGDIPHFPYLGGWDGVGVFSGWGCGACLAVTYDDKTVNIVVVDRIEYGLDIAETAVDELTDGQATQIGLFDAKVKVVASSACGVPPRERSEDALA
ncbi:hypothetical protein LTR95_006176 [Oleoguttula sp. CCFEE 5521]